MTPIMIGPTILPMTEKTNANNYDKSLSRLESRLDELLHFSRTLKQENAHLRKKNAQLQEDYVSLRASRDQVRTQVESMITRLKSMENE